MPTVKTVPFSTLTPPTLAFTQAPDAPILPTSWQCTAILHPFSPPPANDPQPNVPFYQLCTATIGYIANKVMSVQITGVSYGTWWYMITPAGTQLSTDMGKTWTSVAMGWTLPSTSWLGDNGVFFTSEYLNWMKAQRLDWWKTPVPNSPATTWFWFNSDGANAGLPFRIMFGSPPPTPVTGDPNQLAVFQNFSFTYFPTFTATSTPVIDTWTPPRIAGFDAGNPDNYELVVWSSCFGMTVAMTPVDSASFPLPTVVYYQWQPDADYRVLTDRAQNTIMLYSFNPQSGIVDQSALLYGVAPAGVTPPPNSGNGFIYTDESQGPPQCESLGLGQESPTWASTPGVDGTIQATVFNNPTLCPDEVVTIISIIFPASAEYPQGRYLWTWYSPFPDSNGTAARPVTFMESASQIGVGTSLALADYFGYFPFNEPIPPDVFALPSVCTAGTLRQATRVKLIGRPRVASPAPAGSPGVNPPGIPVKA
jgi:hypothetical protein